MEVRAIGDYIMFPLKFCLFSRVFLPSLSPPDLSEKPNFDLSHAFSNKLGPGAAGRHSGLWVSARRLKFPSGSVEGELASFFVAASVGGGVGGGGRIIIRFRGAWRDVNLQSESAGSGSVQSPG